ncbi:MAG: PSD1 and planctomycete cytochrome C domain-containing protein [Phycisphaerae bacterium]|nr:PSD1 and planctomycete cytochrome C domain-containing protein [Phycisphaerae bacterium]
MIVLGCVLTPADADDAMNEAGAVIEELAPTAQELQFFESKIRPVLVTHCYSCHAADAKRVRGNFLLDTRDGLRKGGDLGPAVVPGDIESSLLLRALRYADDDLQMPPKGKLDGSVIAEFERWITMGAPDPRFTDAGIISGGGAAVSTYGVDLEKGRSFWAFRAPIKPAVPPVVATAWPLNTVDHFTLAAMEEAGVAPVADADRRAWLRRVTFDLTGLPPTLEDIAAFERDTSAGAHAAVVDRLLASHAYGERWGRHWLDVARYGESSGKESNVLYPHAWRYRDYVINAFHTDKPFDLFVQEQIAGDLLPSQDATDRAENLIATGYLAIGPKSHSAQNPRQFAADVIDEQVDAMSQGILGLTIACARCHDHKFDPIPQKDYYAVAGIFASSLTAFGTERGPGNRHVAPLVELPESADIPNGPSMPAQRRSLIAAAASKLKAEYERGAEQAQMARENGREDAVNRNRLRNQRDQSAILETVVERFDADGHATAINRVAMGVVERDRPVDAPLLTRGEIDKPGERIPRGFAQILMTESTTPVTEGSGRRELAAWLTADENPLTARVWANRVWLHLFGKGIVPTPDNFGMGGLPPTDQALLDWLAVRLMEHDWSTKALVRELVLSRTYRLAADGNAANQALDPENNTLWRFPGKRLEAEAIRDTMLAVAGTLRTAPPIGSPVNFAEGALRGNDQRQLLDLTGNDPVRSVYLPIVRDQLPESLDVFDFADPTFVMGDRAETNVATQALYLMNAPDVMSAADAFAARLLALDGSDADRIVAAFELCFARRPQGPEVSASRAFLKDFVKAMPATADATGESSGRRAGRRMRDRAAPRPAASSETAAWSAFCQALFQSGEFRTLN